jgi:peptide/nickel transport system substrate-binding protein
MRLKGDETLGMRSQLSEVAGATAENGEVVIRTGRPSARLLNELAQVPMVRAGATRESLEKQPNGTGPYAVDSWEPGRRLRLRRHEGYWGAKPAYPRVDIEMGVSEEKAVAGLQAGRFSLVARINRAGVERAAMANPRYRLVRQPSLFLTHLAFNVVNPTLPGTAGLPNPFRRAEVRQAIDLALDRDRVAAARSPNAVPARHIVTQMVFGHDPGAPAPARDIQAARRLLKSAGYPNGFDVTLHDVNPGPNPSADEVKAQLLAIGIRVTIEPAPTVEAFFGPLRRREFVFWMAGDGAMTGEAGGLLASQFHSLDLARNLGVENYGGYADPELDRLIEEADVLYDPGLRLPVLQKAVRRAEQDRFWIPLYHSSVLFVADRDLAFQSREDLVLRYAEIGVPSR